jgi:hypothetical protein
MWFVHLVLTLPDCLATAYGLLSCKVTVAAVQGTRCSQGLSQHQSEVVQSS